MCVSPSSLPVLFLSASCVPRLWTPFATFRRGQKAVIPRRLDAPAAFPRLLPLCACPPSPGCRLRDSPLLTRVVRAAPRRHSCGQHCRLVGGMPHRRGTRPAQVGDSCLLLPGWLLVVIRPPRCSQWRSTGEELPCWARGLTCFPGNPLIAACPHPSPKLASADRLFEINHPLLLPLGEDCFLFSKCRPASFQQPPALFSRRCGCGSSSSRESR